MSGKTKRDQGIKRAVDHANQEQPRWAERAFNYLKEYARSNQTFMTEQLRAKVEATRADLIPPHARAWGGIIRKAKKANIIRSISLKQVTNPNAHCAIATLWGSNIYDHGTA